ncbi:MAG: GAF domain-containing protein [Candidatus Wallbacteria bacterium]|nr:GAF domain-containing protein [Candidatus Wallbacteria bacterium]
MNYIDKKFLQFLADFCEVNGCHLVIRDRRNNEIFNFSGKNVELPYETKVTSGHHRLNFKTDRENVVPLIEYLLRDRLHSIAARDENLHKEKLIYSLKKVSEGMSNIYDQKAVLQMILDVATEVTTAHTGAILLLDDEEFLNITVAKGKDQDLVNKVKLHLGQGITGWAAQNARLLNVPDVRKDERFYATYEEVKSELAVPLMSGDEVIGVLNVDSKNQNAFSKEDEIMLTNLADQAARIIENTRLYRKASQKVAELSILFQINKAISTILDLDELLKVIVDLIVRLLKVEKASLLMKNNEESALTVKASAGIGKAMTDAELELEERISMHVLSSGSTLVSNDLSQDPAFASFSGRSLHHSSVMSVPIGLRTGITGILNVFTKTNKTHFNSEDVDLIETIAIQVASAISNARLYEKATEKLRELSLINSLGSKFNSSLDIERVLQLFINELQKVYDADRVSLMLLEEESRRLKIKKTYGLPTHESELSFDIGEGIAGKAARLEKPLLVKNTAHCSEYKVFQKAPSEYSLICAPLIFKSRVLGVITLERDLASHNPFNQDNLDLLSTIADQGASAIENAHLYTELVNLYLTTIQSLASAIDAKDPYTHGHSQRVADYAVKIAEKIGCSPSELEVIRHTALLHDIGKIGIPERILLKPGNLSDEEFNEIRKHPMLGTEIIKSIKFLGQVSQFMKHHHERFDGRGYPDGLSGEGIPVGSRIIAIADTFDAMTSDRPYRKSCSMDWAMQELKRCSGSQFDPWLVEAFIEVLSDAPKVVPQSPSVSRKKVG